MSKFKLKRNEQREWYSAFFVCEQYSLSIISSCSNASQKLVGSACKRARSYIPLSLRRVIPTVTRINVILWHLANDGFHRNQFGQLRGSCFFFFKLESSKREKNSGRWPTIRARSVWRNVKADLSLGPALILKQKPTGLNLNDLKRQPTANNPFVLKSDFSNWKSIKNVTNFKLLTKKNGQKSDLSKGRAFQKKCFFF